MITSRSDRSKNTSLPVGNSLRSVWSTDSPHTLNRGSDVLDNIRYDAAHLVVSLTLTFVFKDRSRFTVQYTFVVHSTVDSSQLPHGVDGVEPHFIHIIHLNGREFFLLEFERTLATVVQIISWSETFCDGNERIEKYWFYFLFISFIMLMLRLVEYLSFMKIVFLHGNSLEYLDDTWKSNISWH